MANYIPFEKLEVGKTYYMQSEYWHKVLGRATVTELDIVTGTGQATGDWGQNPDNSFVFRAAEDWMWDEMPTDREQRERHSVGWKEGYYPPRMYEGVMYDGRKLTDEWKKLLDQLSENLFQTFIHDNRFREDRNGDGYFIWESKLDYDISALLIRVNGEIDYDSVNYLNDRAFDIEPGGRVIYRTYTGKIRLKLDPSEKKILYP